MESDFVELKVKGCCCGNRQLRLLAVMLVPVTGTYCISFKISSDQRLLHCCNLVDVSFDISSEKGKLALHAFK